MRFYPMNLLCVFIYIYIYIYIYISESDSMNKVEKSKLDEYIVI